MNPIMDCQCAQGWISCKCVILGQPKQVHESGVCKGDMKHYIDTIHSVPKYDGRYRVSLMHVLHGKIDM